MLRQVFADVTAQGGWDDVERNGAARLAVRHFVDDARAVGMRVEDVIVEAVGITGAASSGDSFTSATLISTGPTLALTPSETCTRRS